MANAGANERLRVKASLRGGGGERGGLVGLGKVAFWMVFGIFSKNFNRERCRHDWTPRALPKIGPVAWPTTHAEPTTTATRVHEAEAFYVCGQQ